MRLKSFHAATMNEAMAAVRDALGDDAIIVAARDEDDGGVRITAAIEPPEPANDVPPAEIAEMWDPTRGLSETDITEDLSDLLYRHGVPGRIMDQMMTAAMRHGAAPDLKSLLTEVLRDLLPFEPLVPTAARPVILVGPPGVGKTLTIAKLATQAHLKERRTAVFTTDVVRAGGVEQLDAFTRLLGLDLVAAETPSALADGVDSVRDQSDLILIDSAGYNPFEVDDMAQLVALLKSMGGLKAVDAVLVLPAGSDPQEAFDMAEIYQHLGIKRLILSRLDCARRLGGVITACLTGPFQLLAYSQSPEVAGGILPLSPETFADILLSAPRGRP
jgi:flagellar biosynthesis protein FlhF